MRPWVGYILKPDFTISLIRMNNQLSLQPLYRSKRVKPNSATTIVFVGVMIAVIVGVDIMFFRGKIWERLVINIGIVLLFGAIYFRLFSTRWKADS